MKALHLFIIGLGCFAVASGIIGVANLLALMHGR